MGIVALVMAGGKGSRLNLSEEKPLIKLAGVPVINYVLQALKETRNIDNIVVATSNNTPRTTAILSKLPLTIIKTPGREFVYDMAYAIKKLKLKTVLVIGSDLPLITGDIIDFIIKKFNISGKSTLNVVVPLKTRNKLGLSRAYVFNFKGRQVVPAGINMINGNKINDDELDEEILLLDREEVALNINTTADYKVAKNLISKSKRKKSGFFVSSNFNHSNNIGASCK